MSFASEHRVVLAAHAQELQGISADAARTRLRQLTAAGYLRRDAVFHRQPPCYQITRAGLAAIGSGFTQPRLDLARYAHDVGLAWLALAARGGAFGQLREVVAERRMRSLDAVPDRDGDPFGVRLGGYGRGGRERLHYPDLLLVSPAGRRIALELELSAKGRLRREAILSGYGADRRIAGVLYLVERPAVGHAIERSARALGVDWLVRVQPFRWGSSSGCPGASVVAAPQVAARAADRQRSAPRELAG